MELGVDIVFVISGGDDADSSRISCLFYFLFHETFLVDRVFIVFTRVGWRLLIGRTIRHYLEKSPEPLEGIPGEICFPIFFLTFSDDFFYLLLPVIVDWTQEDLYDSGVIFTELPES